MLLKRTETPPGAAAVTLRSAQHNFNDISNFETFKDSGELYCSAPKMSPHAPRSPPPLRTYPKHVRHSPYARNGTTTSSFPWRPHSGSSNTSSPRGPYRYRPY